MLSQFLVTFCQTQKPDAPFHGIVHDYSCADWNSLHDHLRDVPWENIFKLNVSAAAREFCKWVQVRIDVYIPHCKYQVKPYSSPWVFSLLSVFSKVFEKL